MRTNSRGSGLVADTQKALDPLQVFRPATVADAIAAYASTPGTVFAAGGTDLVAQFREGLRPTGLIALAGIEELRKAEHVDGALRIGALLTHRTGPTNSVVAKTIPALAAAWGEIATVRIRYRATVGGNLMAVRCRYEMPVMLTALDAVMELSGTDGDRELTVHDLWQHRSRPPGLLRHVTINTESLAWFSYDRSLRPWATVAVAVRTREDGLTVTATVGSEYRPPVCVSVQTDAGNLADLNADGVAKHLADLLPDSIGDYAGSADYRRRLVHTLLTRQLTAATKGQRP